MFSSDRERRLWGWTAAAVAAIYVSLPFGSTLAGALQADGLMGALFTLCLLTVLATVLTQGLKVQPRGREIGVGIGVATVYVLVFVRLGNSIERSHLMEYSVVAVLVYEALAERVARGRRVRAPWLLAIAGTCGVGVVDEWIQYFLPSRVFDPDDLLFNTLAAVMAVAGMAALGRVRRRRERTASS